MTAVSRAFLSDIMHFFENFHIIYKEKYKEKEII